MTVSEESIRQGLLTGLLGYHLRRAQSAVFADFMKTMSDDQMTPGQFGVLVLIDETPGLNQSELARALGIERSTMVGVIDQLQDRGLVMREKSPNDKRAHSLNLTDAGRDLLNAVKPRVVEHERRIAANLDPADRSALIDMLGRIADQATGRTAGTPVRATSWAGNGHPDRAGFFRGRAGPSDPG